MGRKHTHTHTLLGFRCFLLLDLFVRISKRIALPIVFHPEKENQASRVEEVLSIYNICFMLITNKSQFSCVKVLAAFSPINSLRLELEIELHKL